MKDDIVQLMNGHWSAALELAGVHESFLSGQHGPCPLCGGTKRFRFDDKQGRGTYFCNDCDPGDGMTLLMRFRGWNFREAAQWLREDFLCIAKSDLARPQAQPRLNAPMPASASSTKDLDAIRQRLRRLWESAKPVSVGDPVCKYLTATRRYPMQLESLNPRIVRTRQALPYYVKKRCDDGIYRFEKIGEYWAMLWLVQNPDGRGAAIHRTYLTQEGRKAPVPEPRKLTESLGIEGGAIRIGRPEAVLGVAEGIETALGAHHLRGRVFPVWSCVAKDILAKFVPPPWVEELIVFADNDPLDSKGKNPGVEAALALRERVWEMGKQCRILVPPKEGMDFDNMWVQSLATA